MASNSPSEVSAIPKRLATRKANDNPLMIRRPIRCPAEKRISGPQADIIHAKRVQNIKGKYASSSSAAHRVEAETFDSNDWDQYKLVTTKSSLLKDVRHHIMRLHPKAYVEMPDPLNPKTTIKVPRKADILDSQEFGRPIKLHRRDPKAPLGGVQEIATARLIAATTGPIIDEEKEAKSVEKAEKQRIKAEQISKIAPFGGAREKKRNAFKKKTQQVFKTQDEENRLMRYEESQPWFIEDFDNTNTWQGQREHTMSNGTFVVLTLSDDGTSFRMIPIEKWYKFTELKHLTRLTEKEASEIVKKQEKLVPNWLRVAESKKVPEFKETEKLTKEEQALYNRNSKLRTKEIVTAKGQEKETKGGLDEVDYEEDRFENDDADPLVEGLEEEEVKEIENRLQREQLSANAFGMRDERQYDEEKKAEKKLKNMAKKHGKRTKKALLKHEGNQYNLSDSDTNPYASSSESEDEEELFRLAEQKKKEETEKKEAAAAKEEADKRKKENERKKKAESSKKRREQLKAEASTAAAATTTTVSPPVSLTPTILKATSKKRSASPSPTESSTGAPKRPKPNALEVPVKQASNKRKSFDAARPDTSKKQKTMASLPTSNASAPWITDAEIVAVLKAHPEGASMKVIISAFRSRMQGGKEDVNRLVPMLKKLGKLAGKGMFKLRDEFL